MTPKKELKQRIESLEDWRDNVARVGADGAQDGSFELTALTERVAALERAQAEPTNRQCVAEALLEAALSGNSYDNAATWLRDVANYTSIYSSYTGMLRKMADVLERAAKAETE